MINVERPQAFARPVSRFEFSLPFSERRLLLLVGDLIVILMAGGSAFLLHGLLR